VKNKVLVTGGCGYIGAQTIIEIIKDQTFSPISIDNFLNSTPETISRIKQITGETVKNYALNLCHYDELQKVFEENPDIVGIIHFAALKSVPESVAKPLAYYENNLDSLINLLKCCEKFNIKHFIFSSSCSVYGNVKTLPVDENTPFGIPECPYAHTKQIGEDILKSTVKATPINAIALRYFNPAGADPTGLIGESARNAPNLVPIITRTAARLLPVMKVFGNDYKTRDGSCIRDYIHIVDIASAHVHALKYLVQNKNKASFDVFNLGSGEGVTVFEAIRAFEKVSQVKLNYEVSPRRPGDVEAIYSNNDKASSELGWKPQHTLEEMMQSAWDWQRKMMESI